MIYFKTKKNNISNIENKSPSTCKRLLVYTFSIRPKEEREILRLQVGYASRKRIGAISFLTGRMNACGKNAQPQLQRNFIGRGQDQVEFPAKQFASF